MHTYCSYKKITLSTLFCFACAGVSAQTRDTAVEHDAFQRHYLDNQDTRLQMQEQNAITQRQSQSESLAAADALNNAPERTGMDDSNSSTDVHNVNEVAAMLYMGLQQKNWQRARHVLANYEMMEGADKLLIGYAQGLLARIDGDYEKSVEYLQTVIEHAPNDFLLPQLALGRTQFQDKQYRDAITTFNRAMSLLDKDNKQQQGVVETIDLFLNAINERQGWQGSLAAGVAHDNNINQSSGSDVCLFMFQGMCLNRRQTPQPISTNQLSYEGLIERRFALAGHNGVFVRGVGYGRINKNLSEYNQHNITLSAGYSYKDVNDEWSLAPSFSYARQGHETDHKSFGVDASWLHSFDNNRLASVNANIEKQQYPQGMTHYDGNLFGVNTSLWQTFENGWTPFARFKYSAKKTDERVSSYREKGIYLGASKNFSDNFNLRVQAGWRKREFSDYSALLGAQRKDIEREYSVAINSLRWDVDGFKPSVKVTHSDNTSNVDWLYSHDKTRVELKLEKRF